jgi:cyclophilin family peptidyl-prolyl cis-trans isomerase
MVFSAPEDQGLEDTATIEAVISTSCGDISLELDPAVAPETVNSFVFLARAGYFDGTVSHRILPGFVLQAGDPTATGRGGPGYTIPDELPAAGFLYEKGILAMANSGPNTTGSQFFVMLDDAPLPPNYSVFGRVTDGFDALDRIAEISLGPNARGEVSVPLETLYLEGVTIGGPVD